MVLSLPPITPPSCTQIPNPLSRLLPQSAAYTSSPWRSRVGTERAAAAPCLASGGAWPSRGALCFPPGSCSTRGDAVGGGRTPRAAPPWRSMAGRERAHPVEHKAHLEERVVRREEHKAPPLVRSGGTGHLVPESSWRIVHEISVVYVTTPTRASIKIQKGSEILAYELHGS